jgi:arginase
LFLDGHADFYQPEAEPKGEVASMELALATGRGPAVLSDLERLGPLVREDDVVAFGRRDALEAEASGSQRVEDTEIRLLDLAAIRAHGSAERANHSLQHLTRPGLPGFWMHLDADVLDDELMPAVDYRMPGGLSLEELTETLATHAGSKQARGLSITIFNPELDPEGAIAVTFVDALVGGLRP